MFIASCFTRKWNLTVKVCHNFAFAVTAMYQTVMWPHYQTINYVQTHVTVTSCGHDVTPIKSVCRFITSILNGDRKALTGRRRCQDRLML